jgi:hypothetical protein
VSLGIPFHLKKKLRGGCELAGADMQKPYAPNVGREKQKSTYFGIFFKNHQCPSYFIPVKVSTMYIPEHKFKNQTP